MGSVEVEVVAGAGASPEFGGGVEVVAVASP